MEQLKAILLGQIQRYPGMLIQDAVKLIYQNEFGNGHFIKDEQASLRRLEAEFCEVTPRPAELFEALGNGYVRLNLAGLGQELSLATLNRFFLLSAQGPQGSIVGFEGKLKLLRELCQKGALPFTEAEVESYLAEYKRAGYPSVSHSPAYRGLYAPSYRVLKEDFAHYFPLFRELERRFARGERVTLAIDGPSGSGKTTVAKLLAGVYDSPIISMDHFFLQPAQRTVERFSEPGGNIDYERFKAEVVDKLGNKDGFSYRVFDCQVWDFTTQVEVATHFLRVVEGSYSHHPNFTSAYDLKVFLSISPEDQLARIEKRNGPLLLKRFKEEWIPLEERYFDVFQIREQSDLVIPL